jgi:hypothetical protein
MVETCQECGYALMDCQCNKEQIKPLSKEQLEQARKRYESGKFIDRTPFNELRDAVVDEFTEAIGRFLATIEAKDKALDTAVGLLKRCVAYDTIEPEKVILDIVAFLAEQGKE